MGRWFKVNYHRFGNWQRFLFSSHLVSTTIPHLGWPRIFTRELLLIEKLQLVHTNNFSWCCCKKIRHCIASSISSVVVAFFFVIHASKKNVIGLLVLMCCMREGDRNRSVDGRRNCERACSGRCVSWRRGCSGMRSICGNFGQITNLDCTLDIIVAPI